MSIFGAIASPAFIILTSAVCAILAGRQAKRAFYFFKPLTTVLIILYAARALESLEDRRGLLVLLGLLFSLLGDSLLMFPKRFLLGLVSFLLTHLAYTAAFYTGFTSSGLMFLVLPLAIYGLIVLGLLWRDLAALKLPVIVYMLAILFMAYQAGERYLALRDIASLLAFVGTLVFAMSDSLLAFDKFKRSFKLAQPLVLSSYYVAQWLIALSLYLRFR